jgi:uncharacterized membrane protein
MRTGAEPAKGQVVASYGTYPEAQTAVDGLSDRNFPVEHVQIVGHDLTTVEKVTGRVTNVTAAGAGAASGAWFGLFIGLIVGFFTAGPEWLGLVLGGTLIGAAWGALFGFFAHWASRGVRDFGSVKALVAARYDVVVADEYVARARDMLNQPALGQPAP